MEAQIATAPAQVSIINDDTLEIFKSGSLILTNNTTRADKAVAIGNIILADIKANGGKLTPALDTRCQNYLVNCSTALTEMNAQRAPLTRKMDEIKGFFTSAENKVDKKKADTPAYAIQGHRDAYLKQLADEARAREQEALRVAAKAQEATNIKSEAGIRIANALNHAISMACQRLTETFYGIKFLAFDAGAELFSDAKPEAFSQGSYNAICQTIGHIACAHHNQTEVEGLISEIVTANYADCANLYDSTVGVHFTDLVGRIPARKAELEQLANADAETKKKMEEEAEQRRKDDEQRLQDEAKKRNEEAEAAITETKEAEQLQSLFNTEVSLAPTTAKPESRAGVSIEVTDPKGWPLIFQTWFTHEGSLLGIEAAQKVSMGSMIKFCEARAKKYSEKIDSPYIKYDSTVKAVNRKKA